MQVYAHRQPGKLTLTTLLVAAGIVTATAVPFATQRSPMTLVALVMLALVLACAWVFRELEVRITDDEVRCSFGSSMFTRRFALDSIAAVHVVHNPWYYGWGVRMIPGGWMYNVSGLEAVELEFESGDRFRIGTDEPHELARAIERARHSR